MAFFHRGMSRADLAIVAHNARVNYWGVPKLTEHSELRILNYWLFLSSKKPEPDLDHAWAAIFSTLESEGRSAGARA